MELKNNPFAPTGASEAIIMDAYLMGCERKMNFIYFNVRNLDDDVKPDFLVDAKE